MAKIKVVQDPKEEIPTEVLATEIIKISRGVQKLLNGRLNERALLVLLQAQTKMGRGPLRLVLNSLKDLERVYVKGKK